MSIFRGFLRIPQGGFEPPQAEPESAVLPLHNRGKLTRTIISYIAIPCQGIADGATVEDGLNALTVSIFPRFLSTLPDAFVLRL